MTDVTHDGPPRLDIVAALLREWWIIALAALLACGFGLLIADRQTPEWAADATSIVSPSPELESDSALISSAQGLERRSLVATYAEILASPRVLRQAAANLGIPDPDVYEVDAQIVLDSNVLRTEVRGTDAEHVAMLANAIVATGGAEFEALYGVYTVSVLDAAQVPPSPLEPKPIRNAVAGAFLGALVAVTVIAGVTGIRAMRRIRRERPEGSELFLRLEDTGSEGP